MQKNDRAALEELFQENGFRFDNLARALEQQPSSDRMRDIVWDASVLYRAGQSDLSFALAKIAEGLAEKLVDTQNPELSPTLVAGLAARSALQLNDASEEAAFVEVLHVRGARAIAEKVKAAIATALSAPPHAQY